MTGRKAVIGLCMLCALFISAVAAQGAAAANTTATTCKNVGTGGDFEDAHCKTKHATHNGAFEHVLFLNQTTEAKLTNTLTGSEKSTGILRSTQSGVNEEIQATGVEGTGTLTNVGKAGEEMWSEGEGKITYTGVSVKAPAEKGCTVWGDNPVTKEMENEGTITTNQLKATTKGEGDAVRFEPASGTVFATFWVTGCKGNEALEALNHTYEVVGSIKTTSIAGATSTFTHTNTTEQNTLKVFGQKAGLAGTITIEAKAAADPSYTAISSTTTP